MVLSKESSRYPSSSILEFVEASHIGELRRYWKGETLFWQGEPGECAFVVKKGKVKLFPISTIGKAHTYDVAGPGRLVGAGALLLASNYHSMAEALEDTDVYVITQAEFERLVTIDSLFSMAVTKELAQTVQLLADQVEELSLLDVHQRLERCLARLAEQYGVADKDGIKIELGVTHQEIADMIAANRSTVTSHLNKLKQEGLLWSQGRHLVLTLPEHAEILRNLKAAVWKYDYDSAEAWSRRVIEMKIDPLKALDALTAGIRQVDEAFSRNELGLPEIMGASIAMGRALPIIEREILESGVRLKVVGTVVIGTVFGDIHDIGKTIVSTLLTGEGFRVVDLGVDVSVERFVAATREQRPDIVAMSVLMTTTAPKAKKVIAALKGDRAGKKVLVMVGGGAISRQLAEEIGADGYAPTARRAVLLAKRLVAREPPS